MNVSLEWYEISRAALVGVSRNVEALRKSCSSKFRAGSEWDAHILGALGECAFAKSQNLYWNGSVNTFKAGGDVGLIQVRTRSNPTYDLIVRQDDSSDDVFVLVTGGPNDFRVHGWMRGGDAKREEFLADYGHYGEAFFVPQRRLNPISDLRIRGEG